jgi:hypothetical protein
MRAAGGAHRAEASRTFNFLVQEVSNVNTAILSTEEAIRNTGALDILALVARGVLCVCRLSAPFAVLQATIKALPLVNPELEVTFASLSIATERRLCFLFLELIHNLAIRDVAHLVVLLHDQSLTVADTVFSIRHHGIACAVRFADIAVYSLPSFMTFALFPFSWKPILAFREGSTKWLAAVLSTKSRRTGALAAAFGTVGELKTREVVKIAIETRRAIGRSVAVDGQVGVGRKEVLCANERLL